MKLPPIEKIPEAWSAIVDGRVHLQNKSATVTSSDGSRDYLIKWEGDTYYSNDNATYWQGYPGYPVLAVLMLQGRLPYNKQAASYFKDVDWHTLNEKTKRNYARSVEIIVEDLPQDVQEMIRKAMEQTFDRLSTINLTLTRKRNL